jgi:hypothetical protein
MTWLYFPPPEQHAEHVREWRLRNLCLRSLLWQGARLCRNDTTA